jgi:outer membrane protein assembly factor BamB
VLALLTAAVPLPPAPRQVAQIPLAGGAYELTASGVYVVDAVRLPSVVTAFDPLDGRERWKYVSQSMLPFGVVERVGPTVLLAPDPCVSGATGSTSDDDARTGHDQWRRVGVPLNTPTDRPVAVITQASWSDRCGAMLGNGHALTGSLRWDGVDRVTGAVRWQAILAAGTFVALDGGIGGARWAALLEPDGRVSVLDLATGERSPPRAGVADREARWFTAAHDLVLVSHVALDPPVRVQVTAFDRTTAARVWTAEVPIPDRSVTDRLDTVSVRACGRFVCVVADDSTALDPATGEVRWHTIRAAFTEVPGGLLADTTFEPSSIAGAPRVILHDPATGRLTAKLDNWRLLGTDPPRQRLLVGEPDGDSTVLAWLTGAGLQPLAVLPARFDSCQISGNRVACQTNINVLWIMQPR